MEIKDLSTTKHYRKVLESTFNALDVGSHESIKRNYNIHKGDSRTIEASLGEGCKLIVDSTRGENLFSVGHGSGNSVMGLRSGEEAYFTVIGEKIEGHIIGRDSTNDCLYCTRISPEDEYEKTITNTKVPRDISIVQCYIEAKYGTHGREIKISNFGKNPVTITAYDETGEIIDGPETI